MKSETDSEPYRCAIYFAPEPFSTWWQAGSHWLGRCAVSSTSYAPPDIPGIDANHFLNLTAEPRRYGWHATLKAPFQLASGKKMSDVLVRMRELSSKLQAFNMPTLHVSTKNDFLALRPLGESENIKAAAAICVREFHDLAMPLNSEELERRRKAPLSPEQDRLLQVWGYPWVLDQFEFHFSLTGSLHSTSSQDRSALMDAAKERFHSLQACRFDRIALFTESVKGADFKLTHCLELKG